MDGVKGGCKRECSEGAGALNFDAVGVSYIDDQHRSKILLSL